MRSLSPARRRRRSESRKLIKRLYLFGLLVVILLPVQASGQATYVGNETCLGCHDTMKAGFSRNIHAKIEYWQAGAHGCEACHGPGSGHAEEGDQKLIRNPADLAPAEVNTICLECHRGNPGQKYWQGSTHEMANFSCVSCHQIHAGNDSLLNSRLERETCFQCHPEQKANLFKRSRHPMRDGTRLSGIGEMTCSNCHNPHGTQTAKLIAANSINDKCYECHREKEAPVLREHSPVKENCLYCHLPHGSIHTSLLKDKEPRLCQQCHEQGRHQSLAGAPNSFFVINRGCTNCHANIHGSNHPSGVKLKR